MVKALLYSVRYVIVPGTEKNTIPESYSLDNG